MMSVRVLCECDTQSGPCANDHLTETSDSEDHFSDAKSAPASPVRNSPIPRTHIEKLDKEPSYGEVPRTEAHRKREENARPDPIPPAPTSTSLGPNQDSPSPDLCSKWLAAPQTVVSESAGATGPHTQEFKARIEDAHREDATPDVVLQVDDATESARHDSISPVESPGRAFDADNEESGMMAEEAARTLS